MALPLFFRNDRERVIASFDWTDISAGIGYISYFGCAETDDVGVNYFLTRTRLDAQPPFVNTTAAVQLRDFDIEFKRPNEIQGDAFFNFTHQVETVAGGGSQFVTINVYHVAADTTETLIGTARTPTRGAGTTFYRECLVVPLSKKHFAIGEKLRVSADVTHVGGNIGIFYNDPSTGLTVTDSFSRTVGTDFQCDIPFRIDL